MPANRQEYTSRTNLDQATLDFVRSHGITSFYTPGPRAAVAFKPLRCPVCGGLCSDYDDEVVLPSIKAGFNASLRLSRVPRDAFMIFDPELNRDVVTGCSGCDGDAEQAVLYQDSHYYEPGPLPKADVQDGADLPYEDFILLYIR